MRRRKITRYRVVTILLLTLLLLMGFYNLQGILPYHLPKNIFVSATTPPTGVVNEVAMTLTNTQSSAVSAGTPVSLDVNWTQFNRYNSAHRNWVAPNLENVMFYDSEGSGTGQPLNAWIEGCSNSTISATSPYSTTGCTWGYQHSVVWLKLNATGIPATTTITVYLGFLANTTNNFNTAANGCTDCWGEAPYVDGTQTGINIIHDWSFDDNTGTTATDNVSSGGAPGTLSGGTPPFWTTTGCKFGHCMTFSTANTNYVDFGTSAFGSPPYTLQMWFSFSSAPATSTCYGLALFVGGNLDICNTAGVVKAQLGGLGPATTTDGTSLAISTLYFVSAYVSGTGASQTQGISLNGDAYTTSSGTITITNELQVGRDATPNYCNCIIDNVEMESSIQTLSKTKATHSDAYPQHQYGIYDTGSQVFSTYTNFGGTAAPAGFAQSITGSTNLGTSYLNENNGLNFTISTSVIGSGFPSGVVAFFTFTIQNSQSSAIPGSASVPLYVNWGQYAPYVAGNYQNVEFFDHQVHPLNAWLQTNVGTNGGTTGTVWLQLNSTGIPASTTFTYYIAFYSTATNKFSSSGPWGEAPTLSGTYGQYDDGSHVFPFYDNFAGSSLSGTNWNTPVNVGSTSVDNTEYVNEGVNNGITFSFQVNASSHNLPSDEFGYNIYSKSPYSGVFEMSDTFVANIGNYYAPLRQPYGWLGVSTTAPSGSATGSFGYTNAYIAGMSGDGTFCDSCQALQFGFVSSSTFNNLYTNNLGSYVDNVGVNWTATGSEYGSWTTHLWTSAPSYYSATLTDSSIPFSSGYIDLAGIGQSPNSGPMNVGTFLTIHWVRVRTELPNGVDPTVSMPSPGGAGPTFSVDTASQYTNGVVDAYSTFVAPSFSPAYGIIANSKVWEDTSVATGANTGYVFQYGSSTEIIEYSGGSQTATMSGGSNMVTNMVGGSWTATGKEYLHNGYVTALSSTFSGVSAANSYIGLGMVGSTYSNSTITTYFLRDRIAPPNDVMPSNEILISETVVVSVALAYGQSGSGGVNGQQLSDGPFSNSVAPSYTGNDGTSLSDGPFSSSVGSSYGSGGTNLGQGLTEGISQSVSAYVAAVQPITLDNSSDLSGSTGGGTPSLVQQATANTASSASLAISFSSSVTSGDVVVVDAQGNYAINGITDTRSTSYVQEKAGGRANIWAGKLTSSGSDTVTVSWAGADGNGYYVNIQEVSGIQLPSATANSTDVAFDCSASSGSPSCKMGSSTMPAGYIASNAWSYGASVSPNSPLIALNGKNNGAEGWGSGYYIQTSSQTGPTYSFSGSTSIGWNMPIVDFPQGGGGVTYPTFALSGTPSSCPATISPATVKGDQTAHNVNTNMGCQMTATAPAGWLFNSTHTATVTFNVCTNASPCAGVTYYYFNDSVVQPIKLTIQGAGSIANFTLSSGTCTVAPSWVYGNGTAQKIILAAGCPLTLTAPGGYRFASNDGATYSLNVCNSLGGTCSEVDLLYQNQNPSSTMTLINPQALTILYSSSGTQTSSSATVLSVDSGSVFTVLGSNFNGQYTMSQNASAVYQVPARFGYGIQVFSSASLTLFNFTNANPYPYLNMTNGDASIQINDPSALTGLYYLSAKINGATFNPIQQGALIILNESGNELVYFEKGGSSNGCTTTCGTQKQSSQNTCTPSGFPSVSMTTIYAQIGKTTVARDDVTNQNNNVSVTVQGITFTPPSGSGIQISTQSGIPQTVSPQDTGSFQILLELSNSTMPGEYNVTAAGSFIESCNGNSIPGQIGFTAQVIAQLGQVHQSSVSFWLFFLEGRWWVILMVVIVIASLAIVVKKREEDL